MYVTCHELVTDIDIDMEMNMDMDMDTISYPCAARVGRGVGTCSEKVVAAYVLRRSPAGTQGAEQRGVTMKAC